MKLWRRVLVLSTALGAMVTGCAGAPAASTSGRLSVTAAFYPFQFVAERVGGDLVTVWSTDPAAVHDVPAWAELQLSFMLEHKFQSEAGKERYKEDFKANIKEQRDALKKLEKKAKKKKAAKKKKK